MKIVAVFIHIVYLKNTLALINVARGATGKYCNSIALPDKLFNGQTGKDSVAAFTSSCSPKAYIEIETAIKYFVHYFVMYRGEGPDTGQMAYIRTEIYSRESSRYFVCGEPSVPTVPYDVGVRTNCRPRAKSDLFKVESHKNEGLYISEVELYYMGSNAEETWLVYKGCFSSFPDEMSSTDTDIKACLRLCKATNAYIAMKINECFCGYAPEMEDSITNTDCGIDCNVPDLKCGGEEGFSVYLINFRLPFYDGCLYQGTFTSTLPAIEGDMTPGKCLQYCESVKLAWLSKGNKCECSDERGIYTFYREDCPAPCSGDATKRCGSQSDDRMYSVWRTCINPETASIKCSAGLMCSDGLYDGLGICKRGCQIGFEDPHCLTRSIQLARITTADTTTERTIITEALPPDPDMSVGPDMPVGPDMSVGPGETSETDETPDPNATRGPEGDPITPKKDESFVIFAAIGGIGSVLVLIIGCCVVLRLCKKKFSESWSESASAG